MTGHDDRLVVVVDTSILALEGGEPVRLSVDEREGGLVALLEVLWAADAEPIPAWEDDAVVYALRAETADPPPLAITRRFAATPERLFEAFTEPDVLRRWWGGQSYTVVDVESDMRPRGRRRIVMSPGGSETITVTGSYLDLDPPERLSFSWIWEELRVGGMRVTVTLRGAGAETQLALVHEGSPNEEFRGMHRWGWTGALDQLAVLIEGGDH